MQTEWPLKLILLEIRPSPIFFSSHYICTQKSKHLFLKQVYFQQNSLGCVCTYLLDAVRSSRILIGKQKLGR